MPLALRQGGGSDIGFVGLSPQEVTPNRIRSWEFLGVPKFWLSDDVEQFLKVNGWSEPSIKTKIKRRGQFIWLFRAKAAAPQKDIQADFWHYTDHDQTLHLSIAPEQPRKRPQVPSEQLVGPKKSWVDHAPVPSSTRPEIPAAVLDVSDNEATPREDDKERSPRRTMDNGGNEAKKKERKKTVDPEVEKNQVLGLFLISVDKGIALSGQLPVVSPRLKAKTFLLKSLSEKPLD